MSDRLQILLLCAGDGSVSQNKKNQMMKRLLFTLAFCLSCVFALQPQQQHSEKSRLERDCREFLSLVEDGGGWKLLRKILMTGR
jgi:hypothetical protein